MSFDTVLAKRIVRRVSAFDSARGGSSAGRGSFSTWTGPTRAAILIVLFTLTASALAPLARATGDALIWTDKPAYQPGEIVTIMGTGFLPNSTVTVTVSLPDDSQDSWSATSDSVGDFTTTYQIEGMSGTYTVTASDGSNSASTTFMDANRSLDQCQD